MLCLLLAVGAAPVASAAMTSAGALQRPTVSSPSPPPWPERTLAVPPASLDLLPQQLVPGTDLVEGTAATGLSAFSRIYQLNLATGKSIAGSLVFADGRFVTLGDAVAYVQPRTEVVQPDGGEAPTGTSTIPLEMRLLRPGTPVARTARYLPLSLWQDTLAPSSSSASTDWVGETGKVAELDLVTGKVLRQIALPDRQGEFSVSVLGSMLYAITGSIGATPIEVYAVSLSSGTVVGSKAFEGVAGNVAAVPGGVWVSYRTGMLGTAELLAAPHLSVASPQPSSPFSKLPLPGTSAAMGIQVTVTGQTAWLETVSGIACVDATTGRLRAGFAFPNGTGLSVIGAVGDHLYAVASSPSPSGERVVELEAPASCW